MLWIIPAVVYFKTLQPSLYFIDAGVTVTAAYTLGIPTPPGYPSYTFLSHWFTKFPGVTPLFGMQIFSIMMSLATLTLIYFLILKIYRSDFRFLQEPSENIRSITARERTAALVASLVLAFSYQFWSQTLNAQSYIYTDFFLILTIYLLLSIKNDSAVITKIGFIGAVFLAIASGASTVMVFMLAPLLLFVLIKYWNQIGVAKVGVLGLFALFLVSGIYSYLPIRASTHPYLNWGNPQNLELFFAHVRGMGLSFNDPISGKVTGFTGDPESFVKVVWKYLDLLWRQFTPVGLALVVAGLFYVFNKSKSLLLGMLSIPVTNMVFGGLWLSGNQESWFILSYIVFTVFMGFGLIWAIGNKSLYNKFVLGSLVVVVLLPFGWWFYKINPRSNSHALTDYANNLYAPIEKNAVLFGLYDTFNAATLDRHELRADRRDVFVVMTNELYVLPWYREHIRLQRPDLVPTEIDSMTTYANEKEYNEMLNWYMEYLLKKDIPVYVSRPVFNKNVLIGSTAGVFSPKPEKLKAIPAGLVERIVLVEKPESGNPSDPTAPKVPDVADAQQPNQPNKQKEEIVHKIEDFDFKFINPEEYEIPPYFMESGYRSSYNELVSEYALSYIAIAEKLMEVKAPIGGGGSMFGGASTAALAGLGGSMPAQSGAQDREKAKEFLKKAEWIAPESLDVINKLAITYASQGEFKKTLEYFKKAIELNSESLDLKFNLAKSYLDTGDIENGKKMLQEILKNAPEQSQVAKAVSSELSNISLSSQAPIGWQTFTSEAMNLKFFYPEGFAVTYSEDNLIKLTNNAMKKDELTFLIYSKQIKDGDGIEAISASVPFVMDGVLLQSQPAGLPGFQSIMRMYGTGESTIVLLLLKRDTQGFGVRIFPADSNKGKEFNGILSSIKTLK